MGSFEGEHEALASSLAAATPFSYTPTQDDDLEAPSQQPASYTCFRSARACSTHVLSRLVSEAGRRGSRTAIKCRYGAGPGLLGLIWDPRVHDWWPGRLVRPASTCLPDPRGLRLTPPRHPQPALPPIPHVTFVYICM